MSRTCPTVFAILVLAATAHAHGPQIQITNDGDEITTRELLLNGPYSSAVSDQTSVYVIPLLPSGIAPNQQWFSRPNVEEAAPGVPAFNSGPGIAYGLDPTAFASGFNFQLNFTDGLKEWNGSTFVDPGLEQIQAFRGSVSSPTASAITSDSGPFATLNLATIASGYGSEAHASANFRLLGDGVSPTSGGDDGVYLLSLQLGSTDPSLAASDPYYFVLHKNASLSTALAAAQSLGFSADRIQVVPELSSIGLTGLALIGIVAGVIHRRRLCRV